jgi:hypothetical protein
MRPNPLLVMAFGIAALLPHQGRADIVIYLGTKPPLIVEGAVDTSNNAKTLTLKHQRYGEFILGRDECIVLKSDFPRKKIPGQLQTAIKSQEADAVWEVAKQCIRFGATKEFFQAVSAIGELDPNHAPSRHCRKLTELINAEIPESPEEEEPLRKSVPSPNMKVARSYHFILLYDTPDKPEKGHKKPRHQERLDLMERVYKSFLAFFYSRGVELSIPKQRLRGVLFNEHQKFLEFGAQIDPNTASAEGFWSPNLNTTFFFDHATSEDFLAIKHQAAVYAQQVKILDRHFDVRDSVRCAKLFTAFTQILQEESDLSTVSHEVTHQMAGSTGLLPAGVPIPTWVHEGLATYFECPKDGTWSGVGAINEERITKYRAGANDPAISSIDQVVGNQIFSKAGTKDMRLHGYGQAWAFTHFLMERHFTDLMKYYKYLAALPKSERPTEQQLNELFDRAFDQKERAKMQSEWRVYMSGLKTDLEVAIGRKLNNLGK